MGKPQTKERKWVDKGVGYKCGKPITVKEGKNGWERRARKWKAYKEGKCKGTSGRMWPWAPSLKFNPSLWMGSHVQSWTIKC